MHSVLGHARSVLFVIAGMGAMAAWRTAAPEPKAIAMAAIVAPAAAASGDVGGSRSARAADGLFYVQAHINGHPVRFLVDTGASVVVLTAADAAAVGAAPHPDRFDAAVVTAAGKAAMAWTTLDEVRIAGRQMRGVQAAVMREGLGVSLLGQNMLARLGSVRMEGDRLELR